MTGLELPIQLQVSIMPCKYTQLSEPVSYQPTNETFSRTAEEPIPRNNKLSCQSFSSDNHSYKKRVVLQYKSNLLLKNHFYNTQTLRVYTV
jgi:hypothetical protein